MDPCGQKTQEEPIPVLLVDDNSHNLMALESVLEDICRPVRATSGDEALRYLLDHEVAAILLDVNMPPGPDGFETAGLIRQRARSEHTPIIFMSAVFTEILHALKGYALGAVDYLLLPLQPGVLRAKVAVFVDLFRLRREAQVQAERLAEANRRLVAANLELEAFGRSVSHDLRGPLLSIQGFSEILKKDYGVLLDEQGRDYLDRLIRAGQRLDQIIKALLRLSGLGRAELTVEEVDLTRLAQEVGQEMSESYPEREVEFLVSAGLKVKADRGMLRQALTGLLSNAWKYTRRQARARVELGRLTKGDEEIFFVQDTGVGFDPSLADQLFKAFQRLHPESEFPGLGLGLTIVHRVIARHGGRVWAEGRPGQGATFFFTLAPPRG